MTSNRLVRVFLFVIALALSSGPAAAAPLSHVQAKARPSTDQVHFNTKVQLNKVTFLSGRERLRRHGGRVAASRLLKIGVGVGRTADGKLYVWDRGMLDNLNQRGFKAKAARLGFTRTALSALKRQVEAHEIRPGIRWYDVPDLVAYYTIQMRGIPAF
jgi:hypothetical protein